MDYLKKHFGTILAAAALFVTTCNVNSTCVYVVHQPHMPECAKKLKKVVHSNEVAE